MAKVSTVLVELCEGPSGQCILIDDYRVAGCTLGGVRVVKSWRANVSDIKRALVLRGQEQRQKARAK